MVAVSWSKIALLATGLLAFANASPQTSSLPQCNCGNICQISSQAQRDLVCITPLDMRPCSCPMKPVIECANCNDFCAAQASDTTPKCIPPANARCGCTEKPAQCPSCKQFCREQIDSSIADSQKCTPAPNVRCGC